MADGADAMQGRPARARKLPTWLKDSAVEDNTDPLSGERRVTGATHRAKKRKRADNLAVIGNADDSSDEGDVLYSGSGGEAGDSSDDVEEYGDQHSKPHAKPRGKQPPAKDVSSQAAAGLKALSAKEREHLSQRKRARKNEGTRTEYETRQQVFQRYLKNGRYEEGVGEIVIDPTEPTPEVMAEFVRFFQWYANGRKGDPVAGGRKPKGDQLGQSAMVSLHAALQDYVAVACEKQGKPVYKLAEQADYSMIYKKRQCQVQEHCVPGLSSGAAAAATGDDGVGTESDPEQQQETGDSPRQQLPAFGRSGHVLTPSGYSRPVPGLRGRSISTRSPGGEHYTTFFGVEEGQQAVQWARKQQQERQQQQRSRPPQTPCCSDAKLLESVQALLQQQSELVVHIRAICTSGGLATGQGRQNMHQQVEQLYHVTKQLQQLLAAAWDGPAVVADRGMGATTAGGTAAAGTEPAAAGATVAGQPAWVPTVLQQMGPQVDPISRMFHPHTSEAGTVVNWLHGAVQPGGDLASLPAAGVAQLFQMMMAQLQRVETKLPAIRDSGAAGTSAAAAQTAATVQLDVGAPSGGDSAAAAELTASTGACGAAKASKKAQGQLSFPNFGTVVTVVAAAKWYHKTPLPDHLTLLDGEDCKGLTPSQMQAKESCLQKWRGGTRGPRYQRWYEWVSLMKHVERKQVEMTAQQRKAVDVLIAAAEVDKVRGKESLYKLVKRLKPDGTLAATAAAGPDDGGEDDDIAGA